MCSLVAAQETSNVSPALGLRWFDQGVLINIDTQDVVRGWSEAF